MAASASTVTRKGVPPLRAGQGNSFLLRRLHSLSGIVPVGAFLVEHFISNAFATNGPHAYGEQVKFLTGLPFAEVLEWVGIYIPLLYHAIYGFYVWFRGEGNVTEYPWTGNWMYTAQRWTGLIAFIYIGWHVYTMRVLGPHLFGTTNGVPGYMLAFGKVQGEVDGHLGDAVLRGRHRRRFVALRLWHLAVLREVGHHGRRQRAPQARLCLPGDRPRVCRHGLDDDSRLPRHASGRAKTRRSTTSSSINRANRTIRH